ncbi:MAG: aspartyl protease family protein [Pseudomonadota bacterium]
MFKLHQTKDLYTVKAFLPFKKINDFFDLDLLFDPGCAVTLVNTSTIDLLGYSAKNDMTETSSLSGASGISTGYIIKIPNLKCLGQELSNFEIACHDLDSNLGVSGLLGMNFFKHFRMDIDFKRGLIHSVNKC